LLKKRKQELSKCLQKFFRLDEDPIEWGKDEKCYRCRFQSSLKGPKIIELPRSEIRINPTSQILRGTFGSKIRVLFHTTGRVSKPAKTENQGTNRELMAGEWSELAVLRGIRERCETGTNGGGGGNRTRVRRHCHLNVYKLIPCFNLRFCGWQGHHPQKLSRLSFPRHICRKGMAEYPANRRLSKSTGNFS